jgi:hypothetical protein
MFIEINASRQFADSLHLRVSFFVFYSKKTIMSQLSESHNKENGHRIAISFMDGQP